MNGKQTLEPKLLRRAAIFMASVREAQRRDGRSVTGVRRSSKKAPKLIPDEIAKADLSRAKHYLKSAPVDLHTLQTMFQSFEEMCRRRKKSLSAELRSAVCWLLESELAENCVRLRTTPNKTAATTVYHGILKRNYPLHNTR
jgi:hypothetical protein